MKKSWEPLLLFMAVTSLGGGVLSLVDALVFPGLMLLGNSGIFFLLLRREGTREERTPRPSPFPPHPPDVPRGPHN